MTDETARRDKRAFRAEVARGEQAAMIGDIGQNVSDLSYYLGDGDNWLPVYDGNKRIALDCPKREEILHRLIEIAGELWALADALDPKWRE